MPPCPLREPSYKEMIGYTLVMTVIFGLPIAYETGKGKLQESFCTVTSPASPSSGPGGYVRSQQKVKPAVIDCPYNWMK